MFSPALIASVILLCVVLAYYRLKRNKSKLISGYRNALFSTSDDAILLVDKDYKLIDINEAARAFFVMPAAQLAGKEIHSFLPDLPEWKVTTEPIRIMDYRLGHDHFDITITPLKQKHPGYAISLRNVSRQHHDAEQLRRMARFQESLLNLTSDLVNKDADEQFCQKLLEQAIEVIPDAEAGGILELGADNRFYFKVIAGFDKAINKAGFTGQGFDQSVLQGACLSLDLDEEENKPYLSNELDDYLQKAGLEKPKASLYAGVRSAEKVRAVLVLYQLKQSEGFSKTAKEMAHIFATQLSTFLQSFDLQKANYRAAKLQELLACIERLLLEFRSVDVFFPQLADELLAAEILKISQLSIFQLSEDKTYFEPWFRHENKAITEFLQAMYEKTDVLRMSSERSLMVRAARQKKAIYLADVSGEANWISSEENPARTLLTCPIVLEGELWGAAEFQSYESHAFDNELKSLLENIVSSIALALLRQQEQEHLELQLQKLTSLSQLGEKLQFLQKREAIFDHIVASIVERTRAESGHVLLYDVATDSLDFVASDIRNKQLKSFAVNVRLSRGAGLSWKVFQQNKTLLSYNDEHLQDAPEQPSKGDLITFLGTPIRDQKGSAIGVVIASSTQKMSLSKADGMFLETIAQACSSALIRLSLLEESQTQAERYQQLFVSAERQSKELDLLDRIRTAVARELDLKEVMKTTVNAISEMFAYALVSIYLVEDGCLVLGYQKGYSQALKRIPSGKGVMARAVRAKAALLVEDVHKDDDFITLSEGVVSEIVVPVVLDDDVIAVLNFESTHAVKLGSADLKLMVALGEQINLAVERAHLYETMRQSENRFRLLAENTSDLIALHNEKGEFLYLSPSIEGILGFSPEELVGKNPYEYFHPDEASNIEKQMYKQLFDNKQSQQVRYRMRKKDGDYVWLETITHLVEEAGVTSITSASRDITERMIMEETLRYHALHDELTGLPNRDLFIDRVNHALQQAWRTSARFAVLFLDLDRFKMVNDSFGHRLGDELLKRISRRLEHALRPGDTVARLGGDEFCILLEQLGSNDEAVDIAQRIHHLLQAPFDLDGHDIFSSTSMGIAFNDRPYERAEDILRDADIAMYRAKHQELSYAVFNASMHQEIVGRLTLETDLRRALKQSEFYLVYQPIVNLEARDYGGIAGYEALIRWKHPIKGEIGPDKFIPVAEETGLITEIDIWVMQNACREMSTWQKETGQQAYVGINVSARSFEQSGFLANIDALLEKTSLAPEMIKLELTERSVMKDAFEMSNLLSELKQRGIQVQIDDFGTGYSSLSYLQQLPLDSLKIDRSFVRALEEGDSSIVRTIITLAKHLDLKVIAEGIELGSQVKCLCDLGCHYGQGYFFSKPIPLSQMKANAEKLLQPVLDFEQDQVFVD